MVLLLVLAATLAQGDAVTTRLQQAEKLLALAHPRASGPGWDLLSDLVHECDSSSAPSVSCAEAWDWYGAELENDRQPDTVRRVQQYYLEAVDLAQRLAAPDPVLALALELEAMASADLGDQGKAKEFSDRALAIRQRIVLSMNSNDPLPPDPPPPLGGRTTLPRVISRRDPNYSDIARILKCSGTIRLSVMVGSDGQPRQVRLVQGLGLGLDEKAAESVAHWRFSPALKGDTPVNYRATIEVTFHIL